MRKLRILLLEREAMSGGGQVHSCYAPHFEATNHHLPTTPCLSPYQYKIMTGQLTIFKHFVAQRGSKEKV